MFKQINEGNSDVKWISKEIAGKNIFGSPFKVAKITLTEVVKWFEKGIFFSLNESPKKFPKEFVEGIPKEIAQSNPK